MAKLDLNALFKKEREEREGSLGKETRLKIAEKLQQADKLEKTRGLGALEATNVVNQAKKLRAEAEALLSFMNSPEFEMMAQSRNRQTEEAALSMFSGLQNEYIAQQAARQTEVDDLMGGAVNFLLGSNPRDLERQVHRLLDGEGLTDEKGNKYVRFDLPESGGTKRAILTPEGQLGFVTETRSAKGGDSGAA